MGLGPRRGDLRRPRRPGRRGSRAPWRPRSAAIRARTPGTTVEVLISDCQGDAASLDTHLRRPARRAEPQHRDGGPAAAGGAAVGRVRPQPRPCWPGPAPRAWSPSRGSWSGWASARTRSSPPWPTCAPVGVSIVTVGQYLRPSRDHLPVARYWTPEEFDAPAPSGAAARAAPTSRRRRSPGRATTPGRRWPRRRASAARSALGLSAQPSRSDRPASSQGSGERPIRERHSSDVYCVVVSESCRCGSIGARTPVGSRLRRPTWNVKGVRGVLFPSTSTLDNCVRWEEAVADLIRSTRRSLWS